LTAEARELRLFIAVELDGALRDALGRLQDELRKQGLERLRWTRYDGIHLTLKFLGETPDERVPAIEAALARGAGGHRRHELSLGKLGTFGGRRSPRVLWVDLDGDIEPLRSLQESIDAELAAIGYPREERRFSPHLTLARVRPETAREVAEPIAIALESARAPTAEIAVEEVALMQSTLGRGGAVYNRLASVELDS
jgi:2'-5' RNA ligase